MAKIAIQAAATRFYITLVPAMPTITLTATIDGAPDLRPGAFSWRFALRYPDFIRVPGSGYRLAQSKTYPAIPTIQGNPAIVPLSVLMCGQLSATVEAVIGGQRLSATRDDILIGGTNPTSGDLQIEVPLKIMRKMIQQESGGKQFSDTVARAWIVHAINPNWSSDGNKGVGLGQLTNPPPADEDIWNWRANARHLQERFRGKRATAATLHSRIAASPRFLREVRALNDWRKAEGQRLLDVRLPMLTSDQQDQEGLRAYNGLGNKVAGEYLAFIHEFEPTTTVLTSPTRKGRDGKPLISPRVPAVDASGLGNWSQISGAERVRRSGGHAPGDPDYVAHVMAQRD